MRNKKWNTEKLKVHKGTALSIQIMKYYSRQQWFYNGNSINVVQCACAVVTPAPVNLNLNEQSTIVLIFLLTVVLGPCAGAANDDSTVVGRYS